jgi:hypothetical protein
MAEVVPHRAQVVRYLVPMGMTGTKNSEKEVRIRVTTCAAGLWQKSQSAKTVAGLAGSRVVGPAGSTVADRWH